jgi:hypothetical protein
MPKILIREVDNSTTGIPEANSFAVVVPGYFGNHSGDETEILIANEVYELKSQADFNTYVGKYASLTKDSVAPAIEIANEPAETNNYNEYTKYLRYLTPADFNRYLVENNEYFIYRVEEILTSSDPMYGQTGKLYRTITYTEKISQNAVDDNGEPIYETDADGEFILDENDEKIPVTIWVDGSVTKTITVKFTKVEAINSIVWGANQQSDSNMFCIIKKGNEGSDGVQEPHIGNQIAYELLGLGYTVLYKRLFSNNDLNNATFWEPLKDKSIFDFRYVITGGYYSAAAMNQICALAAFKNKIGLEEAETYGNLAGRGDCIALCDIDENIPGYKVTGGLSVKKLLENIGHAAGQIQSNEFSAIFGPRVIYNMSNEAVEDFGGNKIFPASFHYLACAARTFGRYNEWYAVAGYNRGISNYTVAATTVKLGDIAINTLSPRIANSYTTKSINLVLNERGNYYLWGNRTGFALDANGIVFHHFLNIRQLCCTIKKQLYNACRRFTFDPNSDLLWINFVNAIKPTLEQMKADQGIKGYTITRTANTKKALLTANIRIVPIEAVEDFDISIYLEDSVTGITVNTNEA